MKKYGKKNIDIEIELIPEVAARILVLDKYVTACWDSLWRTSETSISCQLCSSCWGLKWLKKGFFLSSTHLKNTEESLKFCFIIFHSQILLSFHDSSSLHHGKCIGFEANGGETKVSLKITIMIQSICAKF